MHVARVVAIGLSILVVSSPAAGQSEGGPQAAGQSEGGPQGAGQSEAPLRAALRVPGNLRAAPNSPAPDRITNHSGTKRIGVLFATLSSAPTCGIQ